MTETADEKLYREEMERLNRQRCEVDEEITIVDPRKGHRVKCGQLRNNTFHRVVKQVHYCYKYSGYGIQKEAFEKIVRKGCQNILLQGPDKTNYTSHIRDWQEHAVLDDLGNGKQWFLALELMTKSERK